MSELHGLAVFTALFAVVYGSLLLLDGYPMVVSVGVGVGGAVATVVGLVGFVVFMDWVWEL